MKKYLIVILLIFLSSCDSENKAKPYTKLTTEEQARQALDQQDFALAIELYNQAITDNPEDYPSYRFLSAAYAGSAGFDVLDIVIDSLGESGGSSSLLETLGEFVPADPTEEQIEHMRLASVTLQALPEEYRSHDHPEIDGSSSAAQQLELYQTGFAIFSINRFTAFKADGSFDPAKLETMTEADAATIIDNFEEVAAASGGNISEGAEKVLNAIRSSEGATTTEKLKNYIEAQGGSKP